MASGVKKLRKDTANRIRRKGPECPFVECEITSLSDYFEVFQSLLDEQKLFWFRGHADISWSLTPSALRYKTEKERSTALGLVTEFRRFVELKLDRLPNADEKLKWAQVAQHYGLPTRLLDWTQNAAIALYFACLDETTDGVVFVLNPVDLNKEVAPTRPRVFNEHNDGTLINGYLTLTGRRNTRGCKTIAIDPTWNSERIVLQQGAFTLHGNRNFALTVREASSLVYVPIIGKHKIALLEELNRVGVSEMTIFPEVEHLCSHLKRRARLQY